MTGIITGINGSGIAWDGDLSVQVGDVGMAATTEPGSLAMLGTGVAGMTIKLRPSPRGRPVRRRPQKLAVCTERKGDLVGGRPYAMVLIDCRFKERNFAGTSGARPAADIKIAVSGGRRKRIGALQ